MLSNETGLSFNLSKTLSQVEELCQARFEYNQRYSRENPKLKIVLAASDSLINSIADSLLYAMNHYLKQVLLIKKNLNKINTSVQMQPIIDELYFHCSSYHAIEKPENLEQYNQDLLAIAQTTTPFLECGFQGEYDFLSEIKDILNPFVSEGMLAFFKDHELTLQKDSRRSLLKRNSSFIASFPYSSIVDVDTAIQSMDFLDHQQKIEAIRSLNGILGEINLDNILSRIEKISDELNALTDAFKKNGDSFIYCEKYIRLYNDSRLIKQDFETCNTLCAEFLEKITPREVVFEDETLETMGQKPPEPSASTDHRPEPVLKTSGPSEEQVREIQKNDLRQRIERYRRDVEENRKIRSLDLRIKKETLAKLQQERESRQRNQEILSENAKAKQQLEVAFMRLLNLSHNNLDLLEKFVGTPKQDGSAPDNIPHPDIGYNSLENLFTNSKESCREHTGKLGWMESSGSGGSHRKITLPAFSVPAAPLCPISEAQIDRLGFFNHTAPSPRSEVHATTVQPHGASHTKNLNPAAIANIRATLNRAGIDAITLDAFRKAKAIPEAHAAQDAQDARALLDLYQQRYPATTAPSRGPLHFQHNSSPSAVTSPPVVRNASAIRKEEKQRLSNKGARR